MMTVDDELLFAYLDGELDELRRKRVDLALAADPALRARLESQQRLRDRLARHYGPVAEEAVPDRFRDLLDRKAKVATLPSSRLVPSSRTWMRFAALAATLIFGLFLGSRISGDAGPIAVKDNMFVARGDMAEALETQLASAGDDGETRIGLTFRASDGRYCRTFQEAAMAGLACRTGEAWQLMTMVKADEAATGEYRQAGAGSRLVLEAAEALMAGDPLDADAERQARNAGWRPSAAAD